MAKVTSFGKADALDNGAVMIPLVVVKNSETSFSGFIPGFVMKNIVENSSEECLAELKKYLTKKLKTIKEQGDTFPFFPTRNEILKDFQNVHQIEFIKVTSNKTAKN